MIEVTEERLRELANRPTNFSELSDAYDDTLKFMVEDASEFPELRWLYGLIHRDRFIAGGVFRDIFTGHAATIRDIDIWHRSRPDFESSVSQMGANKDFERKYDTENASGFIHHPTGMMVEAIGRSFGSPEDILKEFDFSVTKFAMFMDEYGQMKVMYHVMYFEHLVERKLDLHRDYKIIPDGLFNRVIKYVGYGYTPSLSLKMGLFNAIRETSSDIQITDVKKVSTY